MHLGRLLQVLVVERERLVVVVDLRQIGIGENIRQYPPLRADARLDLAVLLAPPAALPALLVFPIPRIADAGLGFDVVEPGVFHALAAGPHVLAGDRAGVAPDALVEVQHHCDLRADFHSAASIVGAIAEGSRCSGSGWSAFGLSSQSTFDILRMMTNSSRLVPIVP